MNQYVKLSLAKKNPTHSFSFTTASIKEYEQLMALKDKGYIITCIKSIEHSILEYMRKENIVATLHSVETFGPDVHVTVFKNNEYHTIVVPKSLIPVSKYEYQIHVSCDKEPEIVFRDKKALVKFHPNKEHIILVRD